MKLQARPPPGYSSMHVPSSQILLALTISNKCGQAFRWYANDVYEEVVEDVVKPEKFPMIKQEFESAIKLEEEAVTIPANPARLRYRKETEWSMCLPDRVVFVRQDEERNCIYFKTLAHARASDEQAEEETRTWLRDYLNLDVPLSDLYEEWSAKDPVFARFAKRFTGVRMLRQDPWETLCAFICSSNNNIARIGQMVQNLAKHYSHGPLLTYTYPAPPEGVFDEVEVVPTTITYYPFPTVNGLANKAVEAQLRDLSFGYRARYIADTAQMLLDIAATKRADTAAEATASSSSPSSVTHADVNTYLHSIRTMDYQGAREQLRQFPGVGPKVADCILLMAMDQPSSIPVDRHVFQFAERWYGIRTKGGLKGYEKIADTFRQLWGEYAGWAHSVLFTADLRAFQTYKIEKKEEHLTDQNGKSIVVVKEENEHTDGDLQQYENESPIEEHVEATIESPRSARWKKRVYDKFTGPADAVAASPTQEVKLTKTYRGIKRTRKSSTKEQAL